MRQSTPLLLILSLILIGCNGAKPRAIQNPQKTQSEKNQYLPGTKVAISLERIRYLGSEKFPIVKVILTNYDPKKTYAFISSPQFLDIQLPEGPTTLAPLGDHCFLPTAASPKDEVIVAPNSTASFEIICWAFEKGFEERPLSIDLYFPDSENQPEVFALRKILEKDGVVIADGISGPLKIP